MIDREHEYQGSTEVQTSRLSLEHLGVRGRADRLYVTSLWEQFEARQIGVTQGVLHIGENFFPSALLSAEQRQATLGVVDYATTIKDNPDYKAVAATTCATIHPLDGGPGSSVKRKEFLEYMAPFVGREERIDTTSKGADLYFLVKVPGFDKSGNSVLKQEYISVMEMKTLRLLSQLKQGAFKWIDLRPVVSRDGDDVLRAFYESTYLFDRVDDRAENEQRSYFDVFSQEPTIDVVEQQTQDDLPSIDTATKQLTTEYPSSGSHGRPAVIALQQIAERGHGKEPHVQIFYNGDGPNNTISPEMVGFAIAEGAGIVMVTTTKTQADKKGGIIGVEKISQDEKEVHVAQIMELAQAKQVGEQDLFYAVGLANEPVSAALPGHQVGEQYFNTNTAILNETALGPFLRGLKSILGEEGFRKAITPDLIENEKESNGKTYTLLEGAMGSALLNLARVVETDPHAKSLWEKMSGGKQFLRIINLDPQHRDEFFTPIKYPIDYIVQAATDHYELHNEGFRLVSKRPGHVPLLNGRLTDGAYYADVANGLMALGNTHISDLEEMVIEGYMEDEEQKGGRVILAGATLQGKIRIISEFDGEFDLTTSESLAQLGQKNQNLLLKDVEVSIDTDGRITQQAAA